MDPEAQIVGADAWRRLRLLWLAGNERCARDVLECVLLPSGPCPNCIPSFDVPRYLAQEAAVLDGLRRLARRVAGWSDLRRDLYLGVLRQRVEGR